VTESRAEFMPWLLWGFDRQTYRERELVIVDSSEHPFKCDRPDVRVVRAPVGTNVPAKRNLALDAARGSLVAWFDDDDWQHPERLERLVSVLRDDAPFAGSSRSWFVDVHSEGCQPYSGHRSIIFNGAGFRADLARAIRFDERIRKASDTVWMREFRTRHKAKGELLARDAILTLWLCHDANISNPRTRRRFTSSLDDLKASLGAAWQDTEYQLSELRERLPSPVEALAPWVRSQSGRVAESNDAPRHAHGLRGRAQRLYGRLGTSVFQAEAEADEAPRPIEPPRRSVQRSLGARGSVPRVPARAVPPEKAKTPSTLPSAPKRFESSNARSETPSPDVSLVIRATAEDAADLDVFVRHLQVQARHPWVERLVVVEPGAEPAQAEALDATLKRLVSAGTVDRVLHGPLPSFGEAGARFLRAPEEVPLPQRTATELWGLSEARSDHVLLTGTRVLFYSSAGSWIADALARMSLDPKLWLMTTHAGPPSGAVGSLRSLSREEMGQMSWDRRLGVWRSRRALPEYFLVDRTKLTGALPAADPVPNSLGDWITLAMRESGAQRGSLDGQRSWAVHARGALPFSEWPARFTRLIEKGVFPACQRGKFELNLGDSRLEYAWRRLAEGEASSRRAFSV
jgi:hypothetical protein